MSDRRQLLSWCLFDFANSGYSAVISAVVFPVFFATVVVGNAGGLGDLWWGRVVAASMALVAITSPIVGGIADFRGVRKRMLMTYTAICVAAVSCFPLLERGMVLEGFVLALLANIGMEGGIVFYNAYLPEIAPKEMQGRVSAWGFGVGYAGSIIALLLAIPLVKAGNYAAVWLTIAAFFFFFSLPAFLYLPHDRRQTVTAADAARRGAEFFFRTLRQMLRDRDMRRFLLAYLIYEDGVNTVIVFSSLFAATTLGFLPAELILLYLVVQATALAGAFAMAGPIDRLGPKKVVVGSLLLWSAATVTAYGIHEKIHFWIVAAAAGLGLGTVQAASRAFFAQFIPPEHESEYFGVYALVGKSSAVIGPFLFGTVSVAFGSQRPAILAVTLFFVIGLILLAGVRGGGPNIRRT